MIMVRIQALSVLVFLLAVFFSAHGYLFDNRYFPLYKKPYVRCPQFCSHGNLQFFIMTASKAFDEFGQPVPLPRIFGNYDEAKLARALVLTGRTPQNILRSDLQVILSLPWKLGSKLQAEGVLFGGTQRIGRYAEIGASWYFMHVRSYYESIFNNETLSLPLGDRRELYFTNQRIHEILGLVPAQFSEFGSGDIDAYVRFGNAWYYSLKCRGIDAGISGGFFAPTGKRRDITNPASVPFGGNGHWGIYGAIDTTVELKEDWFLGFDIALSKRFKRTMLERLPVLSDEPSNYASLVTTTSINPGVTFYFAPYFALERLREGLGLRVIYYLVVHGRDRITALNTPVQPQFGLIEERSQWGRDHVSVNILYDFGAEKEERSGLPVLTFAWNIPIDGIAAKRSSKTHTISLIIEAEF